MKSKLIALTLAGMTFAVVSASAQMEPAVSCTAPATGTVVVPLMCDAARGMNLGNNLRRGVITVVDGTAGTQTAGFKIIGDDEDLVKINGATAALAFQTSPNQPGHIVSTSPGQTTTLAPIPGSFQYWTGTGADINTATQTVTGPGLPNGLDWNESPGNGSRFFYVGASFQPAADQQRGLYVGTVTLDVMYF